MDNIARLIIELGSNIQLLIGLVSHDNSKNDKSLDNTLLARERYN